MNKYSSMFMSWLFTEWKTEEIGVKVAKIRAPIGIKAAKTNASIVIQWSPKTIRGYILTFFYEKNDIYQLYS